jgi:hypothetical protein
MPLELNSGILFSNSVSNFRPFDFAQGKLSTFDFQLPKVARGIGDANRQCTQWRLEAALRKKAGHRLETKIYLHVHSCLLSVYFSLPAGEGRMRVKNKIPSSTQGRRNSSAVPPGFD